MNVLGLQNNWYHQSYTQKPTIEDMFCIFFLFHFFFCFSVVQKSKTIIKKKPHQSSLYSVPVLNWGVNRVGILSHEIPEQGSKPIRTWTLTWSSYRPVFARFIPLVLKGETLPLGPGLSSLKLEFSRASSRNCCLLMKSCDSSCIEEIYYSDLRGIKQRNCAHWKTQAQRNWAQSDFNGGIWSNLKKLLPLA